MDSCNKRNTGKDRGDRYDHQKFRQCKTAFSFFLHIGCAFHFSILRRISSLSYRFIYASSQLQLNCN